MAAPIVFVDIAGKDARKIRDFYATVFDWDVADDGKFSVPTERMLGGMIREDPPEKRIDLGVNEVAETLAT